MENKLTYEAPSLEELVLNLFTVVAGDSDPMVGQHPDDDIVDKSDFEGDEA